PLVLKNPVDGCVDCAPLIEQLLQSRFAVGREPVEALVAFLFFAPFAQQQSLRFEPAKQGIQGAFIDLEASFSQVLPQGVAVVFLAQLNQNRQGQAASAKLEPEVLKN